MRVHFVGIGGRAMGAIAMALAQSGHQVSGSDQDLYEPMRGQLERAGIRPTGFSPAHVPADADTIVVGKRVTEDNPELRWITAHGLRPESFPEFLASRFLRRSRNAVIAGGVGKTTTTALLAWILEHEGIRPDYLIGGIARNFAASARLEGASISVIEGDEYAAGNGDESPKFLQYSPEVVVITNTLVDHPDLYPDSGTLIEVFGRLVQLLPRHGCLVLDGETEGSEILGSISPCSVIRVGTRSDSDCIIRGIDLTREGSAFSINGVAFRLPMYGLMNVHNAAKAAASARHFGVSLVRAAQALTSFSGLIDRQEDIQCGSRTVIKDKASHPRSMVALCAALRQRYEGQRLISVMQPRATGGRGWIYQRDLPLALSAFDKVVLSRPYEHRPAPNVAWKDQPFCLDLLAEGIRSRGVEVSVVDGLDDLPAAVCQAARPGDVVVLSLREQFEATGVAVECALRATAL